LADSSREDSFLAEPAWAGALPTLMPAASLDPGDLLKERYRVEASVAGGGQAVVYRSTDITLSRPVIVKLMRGSGRQNQLLKVRFEQEMRALSLIDHPGVIGILDVGELTDGCPFLVIQYINGVSSRGDHINVQARTQAMSGPQRPLSQRLRRFKTRIRQRKFLEQYARYGSIEIAADVANVSWRHVYRWKRCSKWFERRCEIALAQYLDRVEGTIVKKGVDDLDLAALMFVARHRIPAYQAKPRELPPSPSAPPAKVNISSTNIAFGHFTDEEMETFGRLLKKCGVPEELLNPAPADVIEADAGPIDRGCGSSG
jgi:hypothetical protein